MVPWYYFWMSTARWNVGNNCKVTPKPRSTAKGMPEGHILQNFLSVWYSFLFCFYTNFTIGRNVLANPAYINFSSTKTSLISSSEFQDQPPPMMLCMVGETLRISPAKLWITMPDIRMYQQCRICTRLMDTFVTLRINHYIIHHIAGYRWFQVFEGDWTNLKIKRQLNLQSMLT